MWVYFRGVTKRFEIIDSYTILVRGIPEDDHIVWRLVATTIGGFASTRT
jgi:hypothetical protein